MTRKYVKSGKYSKKIDPRAKAVNKEIGKRIHMTGDFHAFEDMARIEDPVNIPAKNTGFDCHLESVTLMAIEVMADCPRCGHTHTRLVARPFGMPITVGRFKFPYWAACPETGEPIIFQDPRNPQDTNAGADDNESYRQLFKNVQALKRPTLATKHYPAGADANKD